jgi:hypothetical protein
MNRTTHEFSLYVEITDAEQLYQAARAKCIEEGIEDPDELLKPDGEEIDSARCIQMLVDPGTLPGCEIQDSTCE